ncbi:hypothetical protein OIU76_025396 [Salix suchowensis]|nr:hypothetical protein OIU76_025396 [Salix suchowensis]
MEEDQILTSKHAACAQDEPFTNVRAHAQPYFYTVDLIKFGRGTLQEKKNEGKRCFTQQAHSRTTSKNYRLQITVEGGIKNILRHLIPEEASFLARHLLSNKATLFGS